MLLYSEDYYIFTLRCVPHSSRTHAMGETAETSSIATLYSLVNIDAQPWLQGLATPTVSTEPHILDLVQLRATQCWGLAGYGHPGFNLA